MSKSKKRMLCRLSLVTVVVALGIVAIVQSQRMAKQASEETPKKPRETQDQDDQSSLPKEAVVEKTVVRGNNDDEDGNPGFGGGGFIPPPADLTGSSSEKTNVSNSEPDFAAPPAAPPSFSSPVGTGVNEPSNGGGNFGAAPPPLAPSLRQPSQAETPQLPVSQSPPTTLSHGDESTAERGTSEPLTAPRKSSPPPETSAVQSDDSNGFRPDPSQDSYQPAPQNLESNNRAPVSAPRSAAAEPDTAGESFNAPANTAPASTGSHAAEAYPSSFSDAPVRGAAMGTAGSAVGVRVSNTPGPKHLEGMQTPSLALQKQAPAEIQVGKPATFLVRVQNVGQVTAEGVTVFDQVPKGTRFLDASPQAELLHDESLIWQLGDMKPGEEKTISVELLPQEEGEIGSVARVSFQSQASVRTVCTRPQLELQLTAPPKVLIGQNVSVGIRISNPGTGAAEGVILEENVPEQFSHPAGGELEFEVGTLRPGESRTAKLTLRAAKAGVVENIVNVRGAGNLAKQEKVTIEVIAPRLDVAISGPTKRFLERRANYSVALTNPGTASARNVEMVAFLHKGMKFIEANNQGQYDPQNHAVFWSLEELPAGERGNVTLSVLPVETGKQRLRVESRADLGLQKTDNHDVDVDGLASLFFDVVDSADPIEVGSDTVYRVRVINQGSKAATNVKVFAALPGGMKPIGADGPSGHQINGQSVVFDPIARLEPKAEAMFKIQVRGTQEGRHQIRIQMVSDSSTSGGQTDPVSKEESTLVYSDR